MIKNLFDEAEEKVQNENAKLNQTETQIETPFFSDENNLLEIHSANDEETKNLFETRPVGDFESKHQTAITPDENHPARSLDDAANVNFTLSSPFEPADAAERRRKETAEPMLFQMHNEVESTAETARKSGLAMSAAIALFGSVVFLLIGGWFADLLLGTSPWGIVGGIVLGSLIGFFQFFRMTSQILKNKD